MKLVWKITLSAAFTLAAAAAGIVYQARQARADGISASSPMVYSGTLEDDGQPVEGTRNITLTLWDDATSTASANRQCTTSASDTPVEAGRFRVALDDACTEVVNSIPDLWIEVEVNGTSLGRTKLGAVPYAVEAERAASLEPELEQQLAPTATVVAFAGATIPAGWLLCDGSEVDRSEYASLYAAIGDAHGEGDGSTTFNLPDYRGMFLRGVDNGAGTDPDAATRTAPFGGANEGDAVGSVQEDEFASHTHPQEPETVMRTDCALFPTNAATSANMCRGGTTGPSGGSETRPVNAYVNYIIKY